ncbi:uncharacterized protein [Euwallacea fornicatus]|uniref:uncharacterized protein n=1 Tax=Euwallacea fornicatus TaxID=995702 RepID=UPI0033904422
MDIGMHQFRKDSTYLMLLIWIFLLPFSWCTEEYQREIFLSPRNYNPHPYEHQLTKIQNPGPVVFPLNPDGEESVLNNRYNIITVDNAGRKYPIDITPYAKVAEKIQKLLDRKFSASKQSQLEGEIFDALSHQGAKVIPYPPQELKNYDAAVAPIKKNNYAFAYKVLDKATGDDFSHQQVRSSKATNGEYRVKLPDGRVQIVSYKADKHGYKADVKYEEDPEAQQHPQYIPNPNVVYVAHKDINQIPVSQYSSREETNSKTVKTYDYVESENSEYEGSLEQHQSPVKYVHHTTPSPLYYLEGPAIHDQNYPSKLAHIYTTNSHEYQPSYTQSTASYHSPTPTTPSYEHHYTPTFQKNYAPSQNPPTYQTQYAPTQVTSSYQNQHYTPIPTSPSYNAPTGRYTSTQATPTVHAQVVNNGDRGLFKPVTSYVQQVPAGHDNVINTLSSSSKQNDAYRQTLEQENELPEGIYIVGKPKQ